jgi:hypothetical protein
MDELKGAARFGVWALAALAIALLLPPLLAPWLLEAYYPHFAELKPQQQWALLVPGLLVLASAIGLFLVVRRQVAVLGVGALLVTVMVAASMSYAALANLQVEMHRAALLVVQRDFFTTLSSLHAMGLSDFRYTPTASCASARSVVDEHPVRLPEEAAWKSGLELRLLTAGCTRPDDYPARLANLRVAADTAAERGIRWLPDPGVLAHVHVQLDPAQARHQEAMRLSREAQERGNFAEPVAESLKTPVRL